MSLFRKYEISSQYMQNLKRVMLSQISFKTCLKISVLIKTYTSLREKDELKRDKNLVKVLNELIKFARP